MLIEGKDYKLIPINDYTPLFDLELLFTINPKGKESRQEFKNVAYGISLEYAIKKIAHFRLSNNYKNEAITLTKYFNEYLQYLNNLQKELKHV